MGVEEEQAKRFGEFLVEDVIADGPQATVYKAQKAGTPCALKVLKSSALPKSGSHRRKLAQLLQQLTTIDHPTVVKVLDGGQVRGRFYVAMELMQCPTLAERLQNEGPVSEHDAVLIGRCIAQALAAGEAVNICHGDVAPRNVFVLGHNKVKLADFALSKYLKEVPPDFVLGRKQPGPERAGGAEERAPSAEQLLRSRGMKDANQDLPKDLVALGATMLSLLGVEVPEQSDAGFDDYCEQLQRAALELQKPFYGACAHTRNVIDRLLSPGELKSAADTVAELASTAILTRAGAPARPAEGAEPASEKRPIEEQPSASPEPLPGQEEPQARDLAPTQDKPETGQHEGPEEAPSPGTPAPEEPKDAETPGVLLVWREDDRGEFFVLSEGMELVLGRDAYLCDLVISESEASRKHCTLTLKGNTLLMNDANSYHGTFVNGVRVSNAELKVGDVMRIGKAKMTVGPALSMSQ